MVRTPDGALPLIALILFCSLFMTTWSMDERPDSIAGERALPTGMVQHELTPAIRRTLLDAAMRPERGETSLRSTATTGTRTLDISSMASGRDTGKLLPGEYIVTINGIPRGRLILDPQAVDLVSEPSGSLR